MGRHKQKGGTPREAYLAWLASIYRLTCWLNNYAQRRRYTYKSNKRTTLGGAGRGLWSIVQLTSRIVLQNVAQIMTRQNRNAKKIEKTKIGFF